MRIALIQNNVKEDKKDNIKHIHDMLQTINMNEIDLLVLPEMFATPYDNNYFVEHQEHQGGYLYKSISNIASTTKTIVVGGSIAELDNGNLYNTTFVFDEEGFEIAKYRKMHLFHVTYPDGTTFNESDTLTKGDNVITFDTRFGTIGLMICFDIRFPELSNKIQQKGANIIIVPAAFNTYTGPLHWETTFRSRAVDHQVYMIGCSPARYSYGRYEPYGHSMVVNPFGTVQDELDEVEGILTTTLDLDMINEVRRSIPIVSNKRSDLQ